MLLRNLLFFLVLLISLNIVAEERVYKFETLSVHDGLSDQTVRSIVEDHEGYMWFGTNNGLNRYDGKEIHHYYVDGMEPHSLKSDMIRSLFVDSRKNLWIGTIGGGLSLYNRELDNFTNYFHDPSDSRSINHNVIWSIYEDSKGNLWIATQKGLERYDYESNSFDHHLTDLQVTGESVNFRFTAFSSITEAPDGTLWIGIWKNGVLIYDVDNRKVVRHLVHEPANPNSLSSNEINTLYTDRDGDIWIGTSKGTLECVHSKFGKLFIEKYFKGSDSSSLSDNRINFIFQDDNNLFWIGTVSGLNVLDKQTGYIRKFFYEAGSEHSLASNHNWSGYMSSNSLIWLGSHEAGISIFDPWKRRFSNQFPVINEAKELERKFVKSIFTDSEGILWIGTDYGLNKFSSSGELLETYTSGISAESINRGGVTGIVEDWENNLWVGTWGGGLHKFDRNNRIFSKYGISTSSLSDSLLSDPDIRTMVLDYSGRIFIGTTSGFLSIFDPFTETFQHHLCLDLDSLKGLPVVAISPDKDGTVWIGMDENGGVLHFDPVTGSGQRYYMDIKNTNRSLSNNGVQSLFDDGKYLWIGTRNGLNRLEKATGLIKIIDEKDGLMGRSVLSIGRDTGGNFWISTINGIAKYDPVSEKFFNYDHKDGAIGNCNTSWRRRDGGMYFGGINGLLFFKPSEINNNHFLPPVVLTGLSIFNEKVVPRADGSPLKVHINLVEELTLNHLQTSFSIKFSALNYTLPEKNQYRYILEGFDHDWVYAGSRTEAFYTNLREGTYRFKVQGSNNDGIWNPVHKSIIIKVRPAPWETWWAFVIYFLFIISLLLWIKKFIISRENLRSQLIFEKIEHEKLSAIANKNNEIQELKIRFFTYISHEFRTPLTLILGPLEKIHNQVKDSAIESTIITIQKNAQRLLRLVNQILDLSKIESGFMKVKVIQDDIVKFTHSVAAAFNVRAERLNIDYAFHTDIKEAFVYFDDDKLEKVLYNLLSNAFKFTPEGGRIEIRLSYSPQVPREKKGKRSQDAINSRFVKISVIDNGSGIPLGEQDKIFEHFYRPNGSRSFSSSGLGLSLVYELVKIMKGSVTLDQTNGQAGSCFVIKIPIDKDSFLPDEIAQDPMELQYRLSDIKMTETPIHKDITTQVFKPLDSNKINLPLILIVEDHPEVRNFIVSNFMNKFRVIEASGGLTGFKLAQEELPDLIISDLMMPDCDGYEFNQMIKSNEKTCHIPFILLTANGEMESRIKGVSSGVDDYITKPFNIEYLISRTESLIQNRKELREAFSKKFEINPHKITSNSLDGKFLEDLIQLIEENIQNPDFKMDQIASSLAMSRAKLYRRLKSVTKLSVVDFVQQIRLNRAAEYILEKNKSLSEITFLVGFNDQSYFTKCFRKQFKCLPSEFIDKFHKSITIE